MIHFGIRQSFENIEQIEERFYNLSVPIELAMPYFWDIYQPIRPYLKEIAEKIKGFSPEILSIHSVQSPMTLDTAHIEDNQKIWHLLNTYKENIKTVHLSAKGNKQHHLPIDSFCKEVVSYLTENSWSGSVGVGE